MTSLELHFVLRALFVYIWFIYINGSMHNKMYTVTFEQLIVIQKRGLSRDCNVFLIFLRSFIVIKWRKHNR